ncbi:hypothetical protein, partial [Alistipes onderdonkii]|uniref:hypothetical protein n=1 Tax=Alistipes onderdonkii TaxID=328813 RepID=UPI0036F3626E
KDSASRAQCQIYLRIAGAPPVFCKDSASRAQCQIYLRIAGAPPVFCEARAGRVRCLIYPGNAVPHLSDAAKKRDAALYIVNSFVSLLPNVRNYKLNKIDFYGKTACRRAGNPRRSNEQN